MKLSEKFSEAIFKTIFYKSTGRFSEASIERTLLKASAIMDNGSLASTITFTAGQQLLTGGFMDRAGRGDLYYTLFGYFVSDTLDMEQTRQRLRNYIRKETSEKELSGVYLYCAAIIYSGLGDNNYIKSRLRKQVRKNLREYADQQPGYGAFLSLLACYYLQDYIGMFLIKRHLKSLGRAQALPCTVIAAMLVIQSTFKKPVDELTKTLMSFYSGGGGFKATMATPAADLLSTATALYALRYSGTDLRMIRPDCLAFVDSLYSDGGFGSNFLDPEPDIEYTFYGLLALGALA